MVTRGAANATAAPAPRVPRALRDRLPRARRRAGDGRAGAPTESRQLGGLNDSGQIVFDDERLDGAWERTGRNRARMQLKSAKILGTTYTKIARSIWKSTLELLYVEHGPNGRLSAQYDDVRAMVCGRVPAHGALLLARDGEPNRSDVTLSYQPGIGADGRERVFVDASYYGIHFVTELLVRELDEPIKELDALVNVYAFQLERPPVKGWPLRRR